MISRKGVVEIQFNWIFVLIIGAIILLLFSGFILKYKKSSEISTNAFVKDTLYSILSGIEVSEDTIDPINIPETRIEFKCNEFSIGGLPQKLNSINIFSSSIITGKNLILMTLDFSIPYRTTNLIYLTSPKYRYIFLGGADAQKLRSIMSNNTFNEYFPSILNVKYRGEDKTRFVFLGNTIVDGSPVPDDYEKISDDDVSALKINGNLESGTIEFFEKREKSFHMTGNSYYIGEKTLLGAVFADDSRIYNCVMDNVFEKTNIVTQIYKEKTKSIIESYMLGNHRCKEHTSTIYNLEHLNEILSASSAFSPENSEKMIISAKNLEAQNRQAQLRSCAIIY